MRSKWMLLAALGGAVAATAIALNTAYAGSQKAKALQPVNWAAVASDGTLGRHTKDVTGVVYVGTGQYRVQLKGDAQGCTYQVTGGDETDNPPPKTYGDAAWDITTPKGVFVEMYDATGATADSDFYLAVLC